MIVTLLVAFLCWVDAAGTQQFLSRTSSEADATDSVTCPVQEACLNNVQCYPQDGKEIVFGPSSQPCFFGPTSPCMNCYEYAANNPTLVLSVPGEASGVDIGAKTQTVTCEKVRNGLEADGAVLLDGYGQDKVPEIPSRGHNILLLVTTNESITSDYHFVRQDADGTWSQKHGSIEDPTQYDAWGAKLGANPWNANWTMHMVGGLLVYSPCAYYRVDGSLKISGIPRNATRAFIDKEVCSCTIKPHSLDGCGTFDVFDNQCRPVTHEPTHGDPWPTLAPRPCQEWV